MRFPKLKSPAILAPMSGVNDIAFRALAKKYGAGMTYTEFVSSAAISRGISGVLNKARRHPSEIPAAVQLFGGSVQEIVESAKAVEEEFDVIDINCGCPDPNVVRQGGGSALMKSPEKIAQIVSRAVSAVKKPVTIKIRSGVDSKNINAVEIARLAEDAGAAAIAVHGRTVEAGYSGKADWVIIKKVKESVGIPVIGNGDVTSPEIFAEKLKESGVDSIMIGRAAVCNPYIFRQVNDFLSGGKYSRLGWKEQLADYMEFAKQNPVGYPVLKLHITAFTKGERGSAGLRRKLAMCKSVESILKAVE